MVEIERLRIGSRWEHYDGGGRVYVVVDFGVDAVSGKAVVIYRCEDEVFTRDIGEFLGSVTIGTTHKRRVKLFTPSVQGEVTL